MGFHPFEILIVAVIVLGIFGPKTLQSMARGAGKGMREMNSLKSKVMSELPVEEFSKLRQEIPIPNVPLNSKQALEKILSSEQGGKEKVKSRAPQAPKESEHDVDAG